jgi:hypothetical protein
MADETYKEQPTETIKGRYEKLKTEREPYLRRARECATLTIPSVMPPEGYDGGESLPTPFQSAGSEGVLSLASQLLLALLPPGTAFFKLDITEKEKDALIAAGEATKQDLYGEVQKSLGKREQSILKRLESGGTRVTFSNGLIHLLVCGNVLVQNLKKGRSRLHHLDRYVCKRDAQGDVLEVIVHESIAKTALPADVRALIAQYGTTEDNESVSVDVYTRIYRDENLYRICQEVCGQKVPGSDATQPLEKVDWIPLRYQRVDGKDYGFGRVDQFLGDLQSLEALEQAMVEGSGMAAAVRFLYENSGTTDIEKLARSPNGAYVEGRKKDIDVLSLDKFADFQVAQAEAAKLEARLNRAFLTLQPREAERVTAEEVRAVIAQLEKTLGGTYAVLAQEFQLPFIRSFMAMMQRENVLPPLPEGKIDLQIITGLEALGRSSEFEKIRLWIADMAQTFGPEVVAQRVDFNAYGTRKATALQLDIDGLLRPKEDVDAENAQRQQAELAAKLGPSMVKGAADQQKQETQLAAQQPTETA